MASMLEEIVRVLLIVPRGILNMGHASSERTTENDVCI
jgi:hypothetical protein